MKRYILYFVIGLSLSCVTVKNNKVITTPKSNVVVDGKLFTAVWMQRAAEYKALCIQAYNLATLRLNEDYQQGTSGKPLAVITDIDETFLDNSPNAVHQALLGKDFDPISWNDWVQKSAADTIVGALAFFKSAAAKNITVFYVTNRDEQGRAATLKNLQKFGFPFADNDHLILSNGNSSKEERRLAIEKNYHVILFLGDNLGDFSALFDQKSEAQRTQNVLNNAEDFGKRFIVLPNPNYGDWEGALYQYNYKRSAEQKDSLFKAAAKTY